MTTYRGKLHDRYVRDSRDGAKLLCGWLDCDKPGYETHKVREYLGTDGPGGGPVYTWYVFCSEQCRQYFANSHRDHRNLPPGFRLGVI